MSADGRTPARDGSLLTLILDAAMLLPAPAIAHIRRLRAS